MNKKLLILVIAILLLTVGLSGCTTTNQNGNESTETSDENGSTSPSNEDQDKEKFTTLPDGTKVTGDIDKLKIFNYSIVTEQEITYNTYEKIADGFVYSENASRYKIYGTTKNIAGKMLNDIKITVEYYDSNNIYLSSRSDTLGILDPGIPDTYTWDFEIIYCKETILGVNEYFEYVDHIGGFKISVS